jgi:hypothetical protein
MVAALIGSLAIALAWPRRAEAPADFAALIQRRASAERIGRRYLATLPADTDRSRLRMMSRTLDHALQIGQHDPARAARLLRQGIDEDFRRADTVVVDGWVLAVTEARFCAVIALS